MALPLEVAQVRNAWAVVAGLDQLRGVQVVVDASSDLCPRGWVGLLALDETVTAVVPDAAMVPMAHVALAGLAPAQVTSPEVVVARFARVTELLGPAALFYPTSPVVAPKRRHVERAEPIALGDLLHDAETEEVHESGLSNIEAPAFVVRDKGVIVAACGWRAWPGGIAHLCVLTRPAYRRQGLGRAVAAEAIEAAGAQGLLPQWRARPFASQQLAQSLGLVRLGAQLSLRLG